MLFEAVEPIAHHWMPKMSEMHPNLVGSACFWLNREQIVVWIAGVKRIFGLGQTKFATKSPLAPWNGPAHASFDSADGEINSAARGRERPIDEGQVLLGNSSILKKALESPKSLIVLGDNDYSRGFLVESMDHTWAKRILAYPHNLGIMG